MDTPLKILRLKRGVSQPVVATAAGITQGNYSRIENGEIVTSVLTARRIANFFGDAVTVMQILDPESYVTSLTAEPSVEKVS